MPGASYAVDDLGNEVITLSQSWVGTFIACPEQARQILTGEIPDRPTAEADLGKNLHHCISMLSTGIHAMDDIIGVIHDGVPGTDVVGMKGYKLTEGHKWDAPKWTLVDLAMDCFEQFVARYWMGGPRLSLLEDPRHENLFSRQLYVGEDYAIVLQGSVDFYSGPDPWHLYDWKFSARPWTPWETQRYDHQSTLYTMGLHGTELPGRVKFDFVVTNPDRFDKSQIVPVTRTQADVSAMMDTLHGIAGVIRADLKKWPAVGHGWHCSKKWCGAWDSCRGKHGLDW